jgi:hypothetical protein
MFRFVRALLLIGIIAHLYATRYCFAISCTDLVCTLDRREVDLSNDELHQRVRQEIIGGPKSEWLARKYGTRSFDIIRTNRETITLVPTVNGEPLRGFSRTTAYQPTVPNRNAEDPFVVAFGMIGVLLYVGALVYSANGLSKTKQSLRWLWLFLPCVPLGWLVPVYLAYTGLRRQAKDAARQAEEAAVREKQRSEAEAAELERRKREEEERPRRIAAEEEARRQRLAREQEALRQAQLARLQGLANDSTNLAGRLPDSLHQVNSHLDNAESEFAEGVFAPFWDAIEASANELASFNLDVQQVLKYREQYAQLASELDGPKPQLALTLNLLPDATHLTQRMRTLVRGAQKEPNFAKIYEMRQHNKLLVEGFSSLGNALANLGNTVVDSVRNLEATISSGLAEVTTEHRQASADTLAEAQAMREQMKQASKEELAEARAMRKQMEGESARAAKRAKNEAADRREQESKQQDVLKQISKRIKPD